MESFSFFHSFYFGELFSLMFLIYISDKLSLFIFNFCGFTHAIHTANVYC
jgi:hypothetical protein